MPQPKKATVEEFMDRRSKFVSGKHVYKGFVDDELGKAARKYDPATRSATFVMSTETPDRDGDIIRVAGWDLANFEKNPVAPLFHVMRSWPVGTWKDVKPVSGRPKRLEGTLTLLPEGGPVPEVDQAAWMLENGGIRAVSVGFMPLELDYIDPNAGWLSGYDITKSELYECSLVTVPANPEALIKNAGGDMKLARELVEHVLETFAVDPRTSTLIDRKDLERDYRRYFGKRSTVIMAIDSAVPHDKSAMFAVSKAVARVVEERGIKQPVIVPPDGEGADDTGESGEIEAVSGINLEFPIEVNLTITQSGTTGANTRVGTGVGDEVSDPNPAGQAPGGGAGQAGAGEGATTKAPGTTTSAEPMPGEKPISPTPPFLPPDPKALEAKRGSFLKRLLVMAGIADETPPPPPPVDPGALAAAKQRFSERQKRLQDA